MAVRACCGDFLTKKNITWSNLGAGQIFLSFFLVKQVTNLNSWSKGLVLYKMTGIERMKIIQNECLKRNWYQSQMIKNRKISRIQAWDLAWYETWTQKVNQGFIGLSKIWGMVLQNSLFRTKKNCLKFQVSPLFRPFLHIFAKNVGNHPVSTRRIFPPTTSNFDPRNSWPNQVAGTTVKWRGWEAYGRQDSGSRAWNETSEIMIKHPWKNTT